MVEQRPRVVFMGSPEFAVPSLDALVIHGYDVALVVTQPDRPAGRGGHLRAPAVKSAATGHGLPIDQPDTLKDDAATAALAEAGADIFVVAAYGKILPARVLALPRKGCVNVHASLLPRWRGASPVTAAILAGDDETGVSIMELVQKMDAGPVISRRSTPILPEDTTGALEPRLARLGAEALVEALPAWLAGAIHAEPQDESLATYCHLLRKEDGHLSASMTAVEAERAVRAYDPWPGAFLTYNGQRLGVWKAAVQEGESLVGISEVVDGLPAVGFNGGWLLLGEVQKPGGKRTDGRSFLNGERGRFDGEVVLA